jgi:hypothetical protein
MSKKELMLKFPDDFNRPSLNKKMEKNQELLICTTREAFYSSIIVATDGCKREVVLEFPLELWYEHRKTLACELLAKFGELQITTVEGNTSIKRLTTNPNEIPKEIRKIEIEFYKNR